MELITPSTEISESYFEALEKGYVDKSRGKKATIKDIPAIKNDFTAFVSSFDDLEPTADLMTLSITAKKLNACQASHDGFGMKDSQVLSHSDGRRVQLTCPITA
jgi:hypothetical protein